MLILGIVLLYIAGMFLFSYIYGKANVQSDVVPFMVILWPFILMAYPFAWVYWKGKGSK